MALDPAAWGVVAGFVVPLAEGIRSDSAAVCADGRVLYMYSVGSAIRQGYAASVDAFFTNGSVTGLTTLYTKDKSACVVFRGPGGVGLYAVVGWGRQADNTSNILLLSSASGNGDDWVVDTVIEAFSGNTDERTNDPPPDSKMLGQPLFLADGSWLMSGFDNANASLGRRANVAAIWRRSPAGVWSKTARWPRGSGDGDGYHNTRNLAANPTNSTYYHAELGNPGLNHIRQISAAGGDAGTLFSLAQRSMVTPVGSDATHVYYLYETDAVSAGFRPQTLARATHAAPGTFTNLQSYQVFPSQVIAQKLGTRVALMSNGRLVDPIALRGWTVGSIRIA